MHSPGGLGTEKYLNLGAPSPLGGQVCRGEALTENSVNMIGVLKDQLDEQIRTIDTINRSQRTELHKQNISSYYATRLKQR